MNETLTTFEGIIEQILRRIVREELMTLKAEVTGQDQLLDAEAAAKLLGVSEDWLYRNSKKPAVCPQARAKDAPLLCPGHTKILIDKIIG